MAKYIAEKRLAVFRNVFQSREVPQHPRCVFLELTVRYARLPEEGEGQLAAAAVRDDAQGHIHFHARRNGDIVVEDTDAGRPAGSRIRLGACSPCR